MKSKITRYLDKKNNQFELSYLEIRKAVGVLGMALPVVLSIGTLVLGRCPYLKDSISDYFYTLMGSALVGILCGVSLFLFSYRGFDRWDRITSNIAAVCALGVAFFPMNVDVNCASCNLCNLFCRDVQPWRGVVHFTSAGILFFTLACMSLFLFTKTDKSKRPTRKKLQRNRVYITCGVIMLLAMMVVALLKIPCIKQAFPIAHPTFWAESVMLWFFGISWLVKGETILKD